MTAAWVLAISGALGVVVGVAHADWQWAVEHAQVLAGLVTYPPASPMAIAHARLWSLTSQIGAGLLSVGVSEIALSHALSGLLGLVSFQALAAVVYAMSRDALLAIGSVFVILISRVFDFGVGYPIALVGTAHTHGALALSFVVLAIGIIGLGWYRAGAFLLALSPAVHAALGAWTIAIVAGAVLSTSASTTRTALRSAWPAFVLGGGLAIASYGLHRLLVPDVPPIDDAEAARYLRAFVPFWDGHRQAVDVTADGVRVTAGAVVVAVASLVWCRRDLPWPALLLLRVIAVGGALALGVAVWAAFLPETLPNALLIMMPGRTLNPTVLMAAPLLIGLAGAGAATRATVGSQIVLLALIGALVVSSRSVLWGLLGERPWRLDPLAVLAWASLGLLVVSVWRPGAPRPGLRRVISATLAAAMALAAIDAAQTMRRRDELFRDRTNDPLFAAAARRPGPIITGGELFLIQLRSRRPVLLDGNTLDTLPYALESGPAMQRILNDVYGIDLFNPPAEARGGGRVPHAVSRRVWEAHTADDWVRIGRDYGATTAVAPGDWTLTIPDIARSRGLALYALPGGERGR